MKPYFKYIEDVKSGKIKACIQIKQAIDRFENFCKRDDIYFDEQVVDDFIKFAALCKHFKGKSAGKQFILEPWQTFVVGYILGLKYKDTGYRVVKEVYIQIARKAGKDALLAVLCLYMLLIDGEASPEIVGAASTYPQSKILFEYIQHFCKDIDTKKNLLKMYKEKVECPMNSGKVIISSAEAAQRLDGLNVSMACIDEMHAMVNNGRALFDVLKSSQLQRTQPLIVIITTAGMSIESSCYDFYKLSLEVLAGSKELDNFAPFIFQLDPDDDWTDPANFIKCQPNLGVTVTTEAMLEEVKKAQVDSTAKPGIMIKTFNMWQSSATEWMPLQVVANSMQKLKLEDFTGCMGVCGIDLGSVSDFTALSLLIPKDDKLYMFNWAFIPQETLNNHPQSYYYNKFVDAGEMIVTPGNVTDYDYIMAKINEINKIIPIQTIYTDMWNATSTILDLQNMGYNVEGFSQSIGNFSGPTKSLEKRIREGSVVIQSSSMILWEFSHVELKLDANSNIKPVKQAYKNKIDHIISMITALGGYEKVPFIIDTEIFVF